MEHEEGLLAPNNLIGAVPLGYDEEYLREDLMNLVEENNIYLSPTLTTLNIYNLLLALGIIDISSTSYLDNKNIPKKHLFGPALPVSSIKDQPEVPAGLWAEISGKELYSKSAPSISYETKEVLVRKKPQYGILEWEIPYKPASWVEKITGKNWNHRYNPILLKNKTWIYHIDEVRASTINKTLKMIRKERKNGKMVWKEVYPQLLELFDEETIKNAFNRMIEDDRYSVALIGWQNHMRFIFKNSDRRSISFFDPWMQRLDKQPFFHNIQNSLQAVYGYSSQFIKRKEDQSEENSCVIDSLARALMVAEHGEKAAKWEWDQNTYDYALLAARVIHMNME